MTYLAIIILALLFISTYVTASISNYLYNREEVELLANANIIANLVSDDLKERPKSIEDIVAELNFPASMRVIVSDVHAKVVYDTGVNNNIEGKIFVRDGIMNAINGKDVVSTYKEKEVGTIVQAAASVISNSEVVGVVYITNVASATDDFIKDIKWLLYVISIIVCILIGVLSAVMADVIVSPIEKLTARLRGVELENERKFVKFKGSEELESLAEAFNTLSGKLSEMEEKRRAFVSNASHELKTPLSSIKLLSESVLSMPEIDEETVREFMTDITGEIDRLTKIIERLLSLTKLDTEAEPLSLKVTDINEMSQRIVKSLTPVAESRGIEMTHISDGEIIAMADREKLWQVVYNITDNAIKYTQSGGKVEVGVFDDGKNCRIEVADNGVGIPESDIDKIFDRFYRVDKARSRESGGTGLGLSIVKELVLMHGGDISVESIVNSGTKMKITIPKRLD